MNKSDIHSFDKDLPTFSTEEPYYLLDSKKLFNKKQLQSYTNELYESLEICRNNLLLADKLGIEKTLDIEAYKKILIRFMDFPSLDLSLDLLKVEKNNINADSFITFYYYLLYFIPFLSRINAEKVFDLMHPLLKDLYTSPEYESYLDIVLKHYSINQMSILHK